MHIAVVCRDIADSAQLRSRTLDAHRHYVAGWSESIIFSGPLVDNDGYTRRGQLYLFTLSDLSMAHRFVADDPFVSAGLFASIEIDQVIPKFQTGQRTVNRGTRLKTEEV